MPSISVGNCPLCFKTVSYKNFSRHCQINHNSVDTKEKYKKLFLKFKKSIDTQGKQRLIPCYNNIQKALANILLLELKTLSKSSLPVTTNKRSTVLPERETNQPLSTLFARPTNEFSPATTSEFLPTPLTTEPNLLSSTSTQISNNSSSSSTTITRNSRLTIPSFETNVSLSTSSIETIISSPSPTTNEFLSTPKINTLLQTKESSKLSSSAITTTNSFFPSSSYVTNESLASKEGSSLSVLMISDDYESVDFIQNNVQIKNKICGEIQYLFKQIQIFSAHTNTISNENVSTKNFLIENKSYLVRLKQSISDLILFCDSALEKSPCVSTTLIELNSTEIIVSRDPSKTKAYNEAELRYLVAQGPYQPILSKYPINESLRKLNDTCRFIPKWYKEFPMIEYSPLTDSIYCFCCRLFGNGPGDDQSENAWTSIGVKIWNKIKGF